MKENETKKLLSLDERKEYEQEIVKTEKSLTSLQQELQLFEKVAKKVRLFKKMIHCWNFDNNTQFIYPDRKNEQGLLSGNVHIQNEDSY